MDGAWSPVRRGWHDAVMRWDDLFEDLGAQLELLERQERAAEVAEHTRSERGHVRLADRLAAALDGPRRVRVRGYGWLEAVLRDVGRWLLLEWWAGGPVPGAIVPAAALTAVEGYAAGGRRGVGGQPTVQAAARPAGGEPRPASCGCTTWTGTT